MATFSRTLEHTLRRALSLADRASMNTRRLSTCCLSLIDDEDAAGVMHGVQGRSR